MLVMQTMTDVIPKSNSNKRKMLCWKSCSFPAAIPAWHEAVPPRTPTSSTLRCFLEELVSLKDAETRHLGELHRSVCQGLEIGLELPRRG